MSTIIATKDNVEVGTVLTYAIHCTARYPKFVRVIRRTPSSIQVEELNEIIVENDGYGQNGTKIADLKTPGTPSNKLWRFSKKGSAKIDGHLCFIYDGTPEDFYTD